MCLGKLQKLNKHSPLLRASMQDKYFFEKFGISKSVGWLFDSYLVLLGANWCYLKGFISKKN